MIERAVIISRGGALDFDVPLAGQSAAPAPPVARAEAWAGGGSQPKILSEAEIERFERDNLLLALEAVNWKIKGPGGAAELLGVKPTTLVARMEKWGLKRPERGPA